MQQLVTRVDDELAGAVDALVREGVVASRSDAVRRGLVELIDRAERKAIGERIVAGYLAQPQTGDELAWARAGAEQMIADETW